MWWALIAFIALAILTNSVFPVPFEPFLVFFSERTRPEHLIALSVFGSLGAGAAGFIDIRVMKRIGAWWRRRPESQPDDYHRVWFYLMVLGAAIFPIPYTVVRIALAKGSPNPWVYAAVIAVGRFPRYVLIVNAWEILAPPTWVSPALVIITLLYFWRKRPSAEPESHA